jgi:hypothetical protein
MIALVVLFATGIGEVGVILAGASAAVLFVVRQALRAAGREASTVASTEMGTESEEAARA